MQNMELIVAGNGTMAKLLRERCEAENVKNSGFVVYGYNLEKAGINGMPDHVNTQAAVAVHFGSGRELPTLIKYCAAFNIPILNGSTGQTLPEECPVPLVDAPNLALPIVALLGVLPIVGSVLAEFRLERTLVESHQASKKSLPGTAKLMAEAIGLDVGNVRSVRNRDESLALGVPASALDGHGYHWVRWSGNDLDIEVSTKVRGREPYIDGALFVAGKMLRLKNRLEKRLYPLAEFLAMRA